MSLSGKNLIKAHRTTSAGGIAQAAPAARGDGAPAQSCAVSDQPKINLHRNGEVIEAIEITCACGRTMIVECEYDQESTP